MRENHDTDHQSDHRCCSVFDRWRCDRPRGHDGVHESRAPGGRTSWNDALTGRRLGDV
ncbi:hypothetical protein JYQ29_17915 [Curtobacterium flaccumfaciens pv. flaccumfaciens]|jgi:hypothetical protein|uniref:hypothetical protein n=1 Tax=Curtobacterium TaxID=2034 RepID=UPI001366E695|nr:MULTISPECIES: hypothetical protein [Curtobacterium]MBO9048733.1 hypothetical protein [Curtobacterium flaccumfaciens pv. flaccumfaciens]MBO9058871.1 hypothetical protein [Curtobacterium flaccumfaciens pv. flaccumfaciens]MBT1664664.1 hypothetical protein [Curtobacterium flaccumfaciens pv. flaccumfaciens]MBT1673112.1 hypothetical protein [Curtobacterium flaccumfaciens pv. flaccumfaciens]MCS5522077.1 hypothetical protein [Curtobacterium flaccumfaciens pv. oortii]